MKFRSCYFKDLFTFIIVLIGFSVMFLVSLKKSCFKILQSLCIAVNIFPVNILKVFSAHHFSNLLLRKYCLAECLTWKKES